MPGFLTNDLPTLSQVAQNARVPVDTEFVRGVNPASVAATALQIAGVLVEATANTAASTAAGVVTGATNQFGGVINVAALATAPGATFTMSLPNNLITAAYLASGKIPQAAIYSAGNTGGGVPPDLMSALMVLQSVTPSVGGCVFVWQNQGASALNGTMTVIWHL